MSSNDNNANPRPNLPSLLDPPSSAKSDSSSGGIRLPPISFLSTMPPMGSPQSVGVSRLLNEPQESTSATNTPPTTATSLPSLQSLSGGANVPSSLNNPSASPGTTQLPLKREITKPDVESESDEDIIKYYEDKFGITDFTAEEKHDILQHERRARIEKQKNPNYKTYLCYSIIKRLNAMKDPKKEKKEGEEGKSEAEGEQQEVKTEETKAITPPVQTAPPQLAPTQPLEISKPPQLPPTQPLQTMLAPTQSTDQDTTQQLPQSPVQTTVAAADATIVEQPAKFVKPEIIVDNSDVLKFASKFPRKHLGSLIYNPTPTVSSYSQLSIFKDREFPEESTKIVPLLPELRDHINSIVTVRIPSWQITDLQNNKHYQDRAIWGTDVYTDDSDVLLMLKHNGFLPQVDPDLEGEEKTMEKRTPAHPSNSNITQTVSNFREFVNIIGGDVHVDLLVLPPLVEYKGSFRNGINSRSWRGHDGMSVAIHGVRYGEKGSAVDSMNGLRKRKLEELESLKSGIEGQTKWRLSKEAWKKAKAEMEDEKTETPKEADV